MAPLWHPNFLLCGQQATDGFRHRPAVVDVFKLRPAEELIEYRIVLVGDVTEARNTAPQHERVGSMVVDQSPVVDDVLLTSQEVEV